MNSKSLARILSIHWGFIPGGVAAYARHIEEAGSYAPLSIRSICVNSPDWPFDEANASCIDMNIIRIKGRMDFSWIGKVRAIIRKESPDLIFTHGFNGAFVGSIAGHGLGIPIVSSWHGDYFPSTLAQKIRRPFFDVLLKILFRRFIREIVTVSHFSKRTLLQKRINGDKITVIHNGIPSGSLFADHGRNIRNELRVPNEYLLAGTACRLVKPKGLEIFVEAIAIVLERAENMRFVIWGEGPERNQLKRLIDKLGLGDYITLAGHRDDMDRCISALDIYCMSSYAENFSMALLEAMRAGLPIVATDVGGNPEAIKNGTEGILVPAADPRVLAVGILTLVDNYQKSEQMALLAQQRFLAEFTSEKMVRKTAEWLMLCASKYCSAHTE